MKVEVRGADRDRSRHRRAGSSGEDGALGPPASGSRDTSGFRNKLAMIDLRTTLDVMVIPFFVIFGRPRDFAEERRLTGCRYTTGT